MLYSEKQSKASVSAARIYLNTIEADHEYSRYELEISYDPTFAR
jgi:hypothetical protein